MEVNLLTPKTKQEKRVSFSEPPVETKSHTPEKDNRTTNSKVMVSSKNGPICDTDIPIGDPCISCLDCAINSNKQTKIMCLFCFNNSEHRNYRYKSVFQRMEDSVTEETLHLGVNIQRALSTNLTTTQLR